MKYILSGSSRLVLSKAAREGVLCAFDFDGTLARIAAHPDKVRLRERTRKLLAGLAALYPCLVISGRSRADLVSRLKGSGIRRTVGNHGAEAAGENTKVMREVSKWRRTIECAIGRLPGVWIEDKGLSLAIHYRQAPDKNAALQGIKAAAALLKQANVFGGKRVVNVVPHNARNKGDALAAERGGLGCKWVLFVGDDDNDETAFALPGNVISVRIGQKRNSHARYYLRDQSEIDELLRHLVTLRREV